MSAQAGTAFAKEAKLALSCGNYRESATLYAKALALEPQSAGLHHEIGVLSCILGDLDGALGLFRHALQHDKKWAPALRGGAAILRWKGRHQEALSYAERLLELEGDSAEICGLLAGIYAGLGRATEEEACLKKAAQLTAPRAVTAGAGPAPEPTPNGAGASCGEWVELGVHLRKTGELSRACEAFRSALERNPAAAAPYLQLGMTLALLGRSAEAAVCLGSAAKLDPGNAEARARLGAELLRLGKTDEGVAALQAALKLDPHSAAPLGFLGAGLLQSARQEEGVAALRRAVALQPDNPGLHSQLLAALNYIPTTDRASRFREFEAYAALFEEPVLRQQAAEAVRFEPSLTKARRIRLGYVSGDFRNHSVAFFVEPLLRHHDRIKFEVFCYMTRPDSDAVTGRLRGMADHWRMVSSLGHKALADTIRADGIDVLVDLSSHTAENRLPAFAYKPAPVQVTMIGLMQTTGMRSIDYRITDALLDPPGESEAFNSETLFRLRSGPLVFCPPAEAPEPNPLPAAAGEKLVLACTNDLEKVTPTVCALWARVLGALPEARLLFFGRPGNRFGLTLGRLGIGPERLLEQERRPLPQFLAAHHRIDLALDPFPYNGLTVTLLSAWMGVPCVTLEGKSPPERAAGSLLRRFGLPEFVVQTEEDYLGAVVALARDLPRLAGVRDTLRGRVRETACDAVRHVAELEGAFLEMLARAATGGKRAQAQENQGA
jgi:protein O-GlcNAc transferase